MDLLSFIRRLGRQARLAKIADKFNRDGLRGAFGNKPKRDKRRPYIPGQGVGMPTPARAGVRFSYGVTMRRFSDGSLRRETAQ